MRPILIGLVAALMAAMMAPAAALAAPAATTPAHPPVTPEAKAKGMHDAPGVITAAGLDCQLADARFIGTSTDPHTHASSNFYEIACTGAEGFIVALPAKPDTPPQILTCLESAGVANLACLLPENADPKQGLAPLLAKDMPTCTLADARALGQTTDRTTTVFEVACQGGAGYVIDASFPLSINKPATFQSCLAFGPTTTTHCTLTTQAQQDAYFATLVSHIGKPCTPTAHRWVGASAASGSNFFEVACQEGKGYIFEIKTDGSMGTVADCTVADNIGGGCTLTNARQAQTQQADLYTRLATQAGFTCAVSKYFPFDSQPAGYAEAVELACSNRPDGGVILSPTDSSHHEVVYDCAHSELMGFRCTFTSPDAALPSVTHDLVTLGKTSCTVSGERVIGVDPATKLGYVEVTCSDGNPGYIISYDTTTMSPKEATSCPLARQLAGGCQMPGNQAHH